MGVLLVTCGAFMSRRLITGIDDSIVYSFISFPVHFQPTLGITSINSIQPVQHTTHTRNSQAISRTSFQTRFSIVLQKGRPEQDGNSLPSQLIPINHHPWDFLHEGYITLGYKNLPTYFFKYWTMFTLSGDGHFISENPYGACLVEL